MHHSGSRTRANVMSESTPTLSPLPRFSEANAAEKLAQGYSLMPDGLGFNDAMAPLFLKQDDTGWNCGFFVEQHHLNPMGVCHGGVLMTFADIGMALGIGHHTGQLLGVFTVNMNTDFLLPAAKGDWVEIHIHHVHTTKTLANISALIHGPRGVVARTNGIYRMPRDWQKAKDEHGS